MHETKPDLTAEDDFTVWVPAEMIEKAGTDGKVERLLRGIASTADLDFDNETVVQEGLDLSYLKSHGFINWDHGSGPGDYIGEPVKADVTKAGLYLEGKLYDTPKAVEAYNLAKTLERNSTGRRLGWSIQGAVKERDNGRVIKAAVHHVALTPQPKNSKTFAELVKSFADTVPIAASSEAQTINMPDLSVLPLIKSETTGADGSRTVEYHPIAFVTQRAVSPVVKALMAGAATAPADMVGGPALGKESLEGAQHAEKPKKKSRRAAMAKKSLSREQAHAVIKRVFPQATEDLCDKIMAKASQL